MADIFDYNYDKTLNRPITDNSTGVVYDTVDQAINVGSILTGGSLTLKSLSIGGLVKQVAPGDDIGAAIDAINREGGGTLQLLGKTYTITSNINLRSYVRLVGAGKDLTILDFGNRSGIGLNAKGTSATDLIESFSIEDLTVKDANPSSAGSPNIDYADQFYINSIKVDGGANGGVVINRSTNFLIANSTASDTSNNGFLIQGDSNRTLSQFTLLNCYASGNTSNGFSLSVGTNQLFWGTLSNCVSQSNTGDGFDIDGSGTSNIVTKFIGCDASNNGGIGFDSSSNIQNAIFIGCTTGTSNTGDDFEVTGDRCLILGNEGGSVIDLTSVSYGNLASNNILATAASTDPRTELILGEKAYLESDLNYGGNTRTTRRHQRLYNGSGAALRTGNVVILDAQADGDEITTTTTNGHTRVWGMQEENVGSAEWGQVLTGGFTTQLYVTNSAASIAIGDYISTYSHAYYGKKAVTGEVAIAIALEAPTSGTAQIDALIVSPRQI